MPVKIVTSGGDMPMFLAKVHRATGRAVVSIGVKAAAETKRVTHVQSGTLRRSVHAAPAGSPEGHEMDEDLAKPESEGGHEIDLMAAGGIPIATRTPFGPVVEVGSWLPYACVEWVGRGHPGVTQGVEAARGSYSDRAVRQAFMEEGLL